METLSRPMLERKTMPDLRHMMLRMGGYSPQSESRESLIHRILLFAPQQFKVDAKIKHDPVPPCTEQQLQDLLSPYIAKGLQLDIRDGCWFISIGDRADSGSLAMPSAVIERTARYLMPKEISA